MNKQMTTQLFNYIKQAGYKYSKDGLGFYFNNGLKKFSIVKIGPYYELFYNKYEKGNWILKDKQRTTTDLVQCLSCVLSHIQAND